MKNNSPIQTHDDKVETRLPDTLTLARTIWRRSLLKKLVIQTF